MLIHSSIHQPILPRGLVKSGEQLSFFIVVMLSNAVTPCDAIADKICLVSRLDARSLLVDAVEAADEGVMAQSHVRRFNSKWICLVKLVRRGTSQELE